MSKQKNRSDGGVAELETEAAAGGDGSNGASQIPLPPSDADDPYMSLSEVARYVGKSPQTIVRWCADGLIEFVRVGPLPKIRRSALAKFLGGSALKPKA